MLIVINSNYQVNIHFEKSNSLNDSRRVIMVNFLSTIVGISAFKFSQTPNKAITDTSLERLHYR